MRKSLSLKNRSGLKNVMIHIHRFIYIIVINNLGSRRSLPKMMCFGVGNIIRKSRGVGGERFYIVTLCVGSINLLI